MQKYIYLYCRHHQENSLLPLYTACSPSLCIQLFSVGFVFESFLGNLLLSISFKLNNIDTGHVSLRYKLIIFSYLYVMRLYYVSFMCVCAVSYTHLDVYKRQAYQNNTKELL